MNIPHKYQNKPRREHRRRTGYSLIELTITIAITASMTAVILPALNSMRSNMRALTSEGNLSTIGQTAAMYAQDNDNRIYSFTWRADILYPNLANDNYISSSSDQVAAARQAQNILQRATGRIHGKGKILSPYARLPYRRYTHLVLADYMGGNVNDPMWADPADDNLLKWQSDPIDYLNNGVPYANGIPDVSGYDDDGAWAQNSIRQLWPFSSSYQAVPHSWQPDYDIQYSPIDSTPHLFSGSNSVEVGERRYHQVQFPSAKVHLFEEFDREQLGNPYFAYDHAEPAKIMFDGSINTLQSGYANSSVSPRDYFNDGNKIIWVQRYVPIDTFPVPLGGLGDQTRLNMRYRWTLGGLSGFDYHTPFARPFGR
ncbi:MAG: type II secretion system protein [Phycisphaerales bacterium]